MDQSLDLNIAFSIFNRPGTTAKAFEAIRAAKPNRLFIIADGPRPDRAGEQELCREARETVDNGIDWPCEVYKNYSDVNLGCRVRMATGYDWVFQNVEHCILLEDDCLPDSTFFPYCQELLLRYKDDNRVTAISGNNFQDGRKRTPYSYYFSGVVHVWGWATWRRVWKKYDIAMKLWPEVKQGGWLSDIWGDEQYAAMWAGHFDSIRAGADTWDHQLTFASYINNGLCVLPSANLVSNIGFGPDATHTKVVSGQANMAVQSMAFPIVHPPFMIRDLAADKATYPIAPPTKAPEHAITEFYQVLGRVGILNYQNMEVTGEMHFLRSVVNSWQSPVVFDVGANEGEYTKAVLSLCPSARVFAFEPHPNTYQKLVQNLQGTQVSLYEFGLGDKEETVKFFDYATQDGSAHASLYKDIIETIHHGKSVSHDVKIRPLDDVIEELGIKRIQLLKVDVEGHELAVFRGLERTLRRGQIDLIQFEFNETNVISRSFFKDFWDLLSPQYEFYRLLPNGEIHIGQYTPAFCEVFAFQNIVCVRKG